MRRIFHALTVVVLLAGFYVLCLAILAALIALDVVVTRADASAPALAREVAIAYLLTAVALYVVVRGVFVSTRVRHRHIVGISVTEHDEPALWERVRFLARSVGTRPPTRIYLVPDVNAAVWENAKLLGLIPGRRSMMIGMPLLIALTPAQFDSVIAHELGHYGNRDTRLGALDHRARESVMAAVAAAQGRLPGRRTADGKPRRFRLPGQTVYVALFRAYARLVLSVTQQASRRQEFAADRVAAGIAGQANAAAGLRELPAVEAAFSFYIDRYVAAGIERDLLPFPGEVLGGFAALLAEPSRQADLDELRKDPTAEAPDPFDSHPAIRDRVAAIEALPPDGRPLDTSDARALATLSDPAATLAAVGACMLVRDGAAKQAVDWDTLATAAGADRAARSADPLRIAVASLYQQPRPLSGFLDAVDAGQLGEILDRLPKSDGATNVKAGTRAAQELAKTSMIPMVAAWALAELAAQGRVRWRNSWADAGGAVEMSPDLEERLQAAIDALAAVSTRRRADARGRLRDGSASVSVFDKLGRSVAAAARRQNLSGKKPTFGVVGAATAPVSTEPPPRTIKPAEYGLPPRAELIDELAEPHPLTVAALAAVERRDTGAIMAVIDTAGSDWERRHALVTALAGQADNDDSWLTAWLAAEPDNPIALATYAKNLSTTAFAIRTASRAEDVERDQWEAFFRVLRQAPEHCLHAAAVAPDDPTPWVVLQTIAQGLQYNNDEYRKIFGEVVSRAPYHVHAHAAALSYWLPRWFGSDELAESFVNEATLGKPAGTLLTHLRLEWFYFERIPKTEADRLDFYHGPEVQVAIDDALADLRAASTDRPAYPTQRHWLAYFLTRAGRYAEAYDMFRQIGPYYGGWPWALTSDPAGRFTGIRAEAVMGWEDAGRPPLPEPAAH